MVRGGCIYITTNYQRSTLYIGVTSDLPYRIYQHRSKVYPASFTAKYDLTLCVYYEVFTTIQEAIAREKQLKRWSRTKKEMLINQINREWKDLSSEILEW
ncbi:GIY-YIG nuclease family protein [Pedobacter chitinilyticus]|uniref:GIY-YIG nuclease family protein n=1 Tax=Pedobacter chitinilyticus TaxID=2233776 RepID=A0A443YR62_9SPHI|nr:GIY-YIG nuclease family protein [Pedobacter chitinilyticus]RWU06290.1 GIY-YIG nuclease family protein [Pedobacter chitinilyticus]